MDFQTLRTFVAVAETGHFQAAADQLHVSQQAVSKRVAVLEERLGVVLLVRTARGSRLSPDGQVLLPHARKVLAALEAAELAVRPGSRPFRIDVLNRRIAPAQMVYTYFRSAAGIALDAITLADQDAAQSVRTLLGGGVDATFRAVRAEQVPDDVCAERLLDAPLQVLVGPAHPLAGASWVRPADLAGHRIWIPGIRAGSEWADFYQALAGEFGLDIDALGPHFGDEALMDALAESADLATLVGAGDRYVWPENYGLRRIPLRDPVPVYPHVLLSRAGQRHPVLDGLRGHLRATRPMLEGVAWAPPWVVA